MSAIAVLRHMVKDTETSFESIFGVNVVKEIFESCGRQIEVKKVALQSLYSTPWVFNNQSCQCMRCDSSFGFMRWKHHCRSCGYLVCNGCSTSKVVIPELSESAGSRVCKSCQSFKNKKIVPDTDTADIEKNLKDDPPSPQSVTSADTEVEAYHAAASDFADLEYAFSNE